jgi:hypothetical protein
MLANHRQSAWHAAALKTIFPDGRGAEAAREHFDKKLSEYLAFSGKQLVTASPVPSADDAVAYLIRLGCEWRVFDISVTLKLTPLVSGFRSDLFFQFAPPDLARQVTDTVSRLADLFSKSPSEIHGLMVEAGKSAKPEAEELRRWRERVERYEFQPLAV